jgi:methyltransferase (TIGR00027 family)
MDAKQLSATAAVIAASTALAAREPTLARLLDEGDAALADAVLAEAGPRGRVLLTLLAGRFCRAALIQAERLLLPGIQFHYRARKRRIASLVESELARGASQVVIAGAGYDGLGARLARSHPEARVFELDRPGVLALKRRALERAGLVQLNLHHLSADLARMSLSEVMTAHPAFIARDRTVVVAEGLLMYLEEAEVMAFLTAARDLTQTSGKVVFTAMDAPAGTRPRFRREHPLVAWWLARSAEPFRWSVSAEELAGFLATLCLVPVAVHARDALATELGPSGDKTMLAEGEYVIVAEPQVGDMPR